MMEYIISLGLSDVILAKNVKEKRTFSLLPGVFKQLKLCHFCQSPFNLWRDTSTNVHDWRLTKAVQE